MSRFECDDYEEMFPNQGQFWWSNIERAIKGRHGQRDLRTLEAALLALPEKRLIHGRLAKGNEVCAVAAFVVHRRVEKGEEREAVLSELRGAVSVYCGECFHDENEHGPSGCRRCVEIGRRTCAAFVEEEAETDDYGDTTARMGKRAGMTYSLAWQIGYLNDEEFHSLTPEERYTAVLAWVRERIKTPDRAAA